MSINIEAKTMLNMAKRQILPACIEYTSVLGRAVNAVSSAGVESAVQKELLEKVSSLIMTMKEDILQLEEKADKASELTETTRQARLCRDEVIPAMQALRATADELETMVSADLWPVPTYAEMLFVR